MGTTAQKLQKLAATKTAIRQAIETKGVAVADTDPFALYPDKIGLIAASSGPAPTRQPGQLTVRFISPVPDAVGNHVIAIKYVDAGGSVDFPQHWTQDYLTPDGWTHTAAQLTGIQRDIDVGAMYVTSDEKTHAFGETTPYTGYSVPLAYAVTGTATFRIEWGDGTYDDVSTTGTISHTLTGRYHIAVGRISGTGTLSLGNGGAFVGNQSIDYRHTLLRCFVGRYTALGVSAFNQNMQMEVLMLPRTITALPSQTIFNTGLLALVLPPQIASFPSGAVASNFSMAVMVVPAALETITEQSFNNNFSLTSVILPATIKSIGAQSFYSNRKLAVIQVHALTPPTLGTYVFDATSALLRIYVPDASLAAYKSATNWAGCATRIFPISKKPL